MENACGSGHTPVVIIPGIGKSKAELLDENGAHVKMAWPPELDGGELMGALKGPLMKMMLFRRDMGFSDKLAEVVADIAAPLCCDDSGTPDGRLKLVSFDCPVSGCAPEDKKYIYKMAPFEDIAQTIGEDRLFFFTYYSFGCVYDAAERLREYIRMVREKTGHEKVNLISIDLGGAVSSAYFDAYGGDGHVYRAVNLGAALDGTRLFGDILSGNLYTDNFTQLLETMPGEGSKQFLEIIKAMPADIPEKAAEKLLDTLIGNLFLKSTLMWALVPCDMYGELRDKYLNDGRFGALREKTDRLFAWRKNYKAMLERETARGVEFFNICGYGRQLLPLVRSDKVSSDSLVDLASSSIGAYSAPLGERLPDGYEQRNIYCKKGHTHIDPLRSVDASTAFFPDRTWFFETRAYGDLERNDRSLELLKMIMTERGFDSVFSDGRFPQFNKYGMTGFVRRIKYELLPRAKDADRSGLFPGQIEALDAAIEKAEEFLQNTPADGGERVQEIETLLKEAVELITSDNSVNLDFSGIADADMF